jgi:phosphate transport system substrate-binding protein
MGYQTAQCNNLLYALLASLLCLFTACGATVTPPPAVLIKVAGSTSMRPLLVKLTTAYSAQHPHVTFDIQGGGSQGGQTAIETGQADIGLVSRPLDPISDTLRLTPIARDAVAVIVHPQNRRAGLSLAELRDIFSGRLLNWQELDGPAQPIQVVSREDGSGTRAVFETGVMEDSAVTPTAIVLPSSQAVVDFVAQHPGAIGYVSLAFVTDQVYAVPIDGQTPDALNTYFLTRTLSLLTVRQPQPEVNRFIEFVLTQTR